MKKTLVLALCATMALTACGGGMNGTELNFGAASEPASALI